MIKSYIQLRAVFKKPGGAKSAPVTVRSLESIIRLSEAAAKLKFSEKVETVHVEEATKLLQSSLFKLERDSLTLDDLGKNDEDCGIAGKERESRRKPESE